jgi:hypothetical protein
LREERILLEHIHGIAGFGRKIVDAFSVNVNLAFMELQ